MRNPGLEALLSWERARAARWGFPALALFTDARMADPLAAIARLPAGRAGVVLRSAHLPRQDAARLRLAVTRRCRGRRLWLTVAGHTHWAAAARGRTRPVSAAAHSARDIVRAARVGASLVFIAPVFPTASHPGAPALGALRATRLAHLAVRLGLAPFALGGIDALRVRRLAPVWRGAGAIGAFLARKDCGGAATVSPEGHRAASPDVAAPGLPLP